MLISLTACPDSLSNGSTVACSICQIPFPVCTLPAGMVEVGFDLAIENLWWDEDVPTVTTGRFNLRNLEVSTTPITAASTILSGVSILTALYFSYLTYISQIKNKRHGECICRVQGFHDMLFDKSLQLPKEFNFRLDDFQQVRLFSHPDEHVGGISL